MMNLSQYVLYVGFGEDLFEPPFDIYIDEVDCMGNEFGCNNEEEHWDDPIYKNYLLLRKYY
jgi:hypothetical protein